MGPYLSNPQRAKVREKMSFAHPGMWHSGHNKRPNVDMRHISEAQRRAEPCVTTSEQGCGWKRMGNWMGGSRLEWMAVAVLTLLAAVW